MRRQSSRLLLSPARYVCRVAVRVIITGLIFTICLAVMSRYLGLPVPDPTELLENFKSVSRLSEILS